MQKGVLLGAASIKRLEEISFGVGFSAGDLGVKLDSDSFKPRPSPV